MSAGLFILAIVFLLDFVAVPTVRAQTFTVLHDFAGGPDDGALPGGKLLMDAAGNIYGPTDSGGSTVRQDCQVGATGGGLIGGCGTVFKLDSSGAESVLYSFNGSPDGAHAFTGLITDAAGSLYGTTGFGGVGSQEAGLGAGIVFKLDPSGAESILYRFKGAPDGDLPSSSLIRDAAGNLYGVTSQGGVGCGTVFKLDPSGTESVLYRFKGSPDGSQPLGSLAIDGTGNLYGTTIFGGTGGDIGTVFKLDTSGTETVLHSFAGEPDGTNPNAGLIMDAAGNFYGTTGKGGLGFGTVFKIDPSGTESVLYRFKGAPDGQGPDGLLLDAAGNLFGTTESGGIGAGTIFRLDPSGVETILHSFNRSSDGGLPQGGVISDAAGNLYGTTLVGGSAGLGTVFKLSDPVTFAGLITLVNQSVTKPHVASRMVAKLKKADAMKSEGNNASADRKLEAFIRQVSAQSGKSLTPTQATMLIQGAKELMT